MGQKRYGTISNDRNMVASSGSSENSADPRGLGAKSVKSKAGRSIGGDIGFEQSASSVEVSRLSKKNRIDFQNPRLGGEINGYMRKRLNMEDETVANG